MKYIRLRYLFFKGALLIGLLMSLTHQTLADDVRDADIDKDMARLKTAMLQKDQATLIDMMYERIVELGGGRDKLLAQTKALDTKVDTTSFEASKPYRYFSGQQNDYVVVPTHILMTINDHHYDSTSFELGIKSHQDGKWEYIDGAGLNPQFRAQLLSDIPQDVVLPNHSIKQVD